MTRLTLRLVLVAWIFQVISARTNPRFDMRDKDGIIFDPIAPRAGERMVARCTLVGLTDTDKRSVKFTAKNAFFSLIASDDRLGQLGTSSIER